MKKTWLSLLLVLALTIFLAVPATAADAQTQAKVYGNDEVLSLEDAIDQASGDNYVTLQDDITDPVTIDKTIFLDLNGHTISGNVTITEGNVLKLFDSNTSDYNVDDGNGYGKITGVVTGTIARTTNTPKSTYGSNYRYLTIKDEDGYHAHRFYISVKSTVLYPTVPALNYRTVLRCDSVVAGYINDGGEYGVRVQADGYDSVVYGVYGEDVAPWDGTNENNRVSQVYNILSGDDLATRATTKLHACAYIKVNDSYESKDEITSATVKKSLQDATEEAEASFSTLSESQKEALAVMYNDNNTLMADWAIPNIKGLPVPTKIYACLCGDSTSTNNPCANTGHKKVVWTEWTGDTFPTTTGNYKLMNALSLTEAPNVTGFVCIDLNGQNIVGSLPVVTDGAVLNLTNHVNSNATVTAVSGLKIDAGGNVSLYDKINVIGNAGSSFAGLIDSYGDMNMYGGTVECTGHRTVFVRSGGYMYVNHGTITGHTPSSGDGAAAYVAGTLDIAGDAEIVGSTAPNGGSIYVSGTLNVKGGTISGGKATTNGGNIYANGGTVNISAGSILNGEAGNCSGNIFATSSSTLKVSGGTISGGTTTSEDQAEYANAYVYKSNIVASGGTITGLTVVNAASSITLSGDVTIDTDSYGYGLTLSGVVAMINSTDENPFTGSIALTTSATQIAQTTDPDHAGNFTCGASTPSEDSYSTAGKAAYYQDGYICIGTTKTMCVCGGKANGIGGHECSEETTVTYTALTSATSMPNAGNNYFLGNDLTLTSITNISAEGALNIDLNGHSIILQGSSADARPFRVFKSTTENPATIVNLTDSVGGGKVMVTGTVTGKDYAGLVWLRNSNAVFNQYGGILDASNLSGYHGGVAMYLHAGTYNMYGGEIIGGTDTGTHASDNFGGGAVYILNGAEFNLYDGTVTGGETADNGGTFAVAGTLNVKGGTVQNGNGTTSSSYGGNIYVASTGVVEVSGGTVTGGKSTIGSGGRGGNIYVDGGELTVSGGKILAGETSNIGGNIQTWTGSTLNISGGTISGGTTTNASNGKYANVYPYNTTTVLSGGNISGIGFAGDSSSLTMAGDVIIGTDSNGNGLAIDNKNIAITIDESEKTFSASVAVTYLTANNTTGLLVNASDTNYSSHFTSAVDGKVIYRDTDNAIYLKTGKMMCVCGGKGAELDERLHKCEEVSFIPLATNITKLPTSGNYYLEDTVNLTGTTSLTAAGELNIDLNGKEIVLTAGNKNTRLFSVYNASATYDFTINMTDSQTGGAVRANRTNVTATDTMGWGTLVWLSQSGHKFNLFGGTLDASAITKGGEGTALRINGGSTFNMYGGEIIGGTSDSNGGTAYIEANSTFNLYDGTVSGGKTTATDKNGGNFYVVGTLNVEGGKITGGHAYNVGGNVFANSGTLTVSGGEIYGGSCGSNSTSILYDNNYSNVQVNGGSATLSGGTISGLALSGTVIPTVSGNLTITNKFTDDETGEEVTTKGLYVGDNYIAIDDEKGFTGSIAVSKEGKVATTANASYVNNFIDAVGDSQFVYEDQTIYLQTGKMMCVCGGKLQEDENHTHELVQFLPWTSTDSLPTSGNYYLKNTVNLTTYVTYSTANSEVNIDLNGNNVILKASKADDRVFRVFKSTTENPELTIGLADSVGGGKIVFDATGTITGKDYGGLVWIRNSNAVFNQYGGILDASNLSGYHGGVAMYLHAGTYNMYGGEIIGGTDTGTHATENNGGGAVYIRDGAEFNLYDGTVTGGQTADNGGTFAVAGTLNVKGGTITGGKTTATNQNGGNIYVFSTGSLDVSGGKITGGHAYNVGGNVFVNGGTLTVSDGEIYGGSRGDNANEGVVNYNDYYSNVQVNGGSATLSGGTISGLALSGTVTPTVSGNLTITNKFTDDETGEEVTTKGLYVGNNYIAIDDEKGFTGSIAVSKTGKVATTANADYVNNFIDAVGDSLFVYEEQTIYLQTGKMMCVCGGKLQEDENHTHELVQFLPWTSTNSLPTSGNYYLKDTVNLTTYVTYSTANSEVNIDLNGNNVILKASKTDDRVFRVFKSTTENPELTIGLTDSVGGGKVAFDETGTITGKDYGGLVWLRNSNAVFNQYGGILDASKLSGYHGGVAMYLHAGTYNMYGGEIIGGTDTGTSENNGGGAVYILNGAEFNLYDGTVTGGETADNGGTFAVAGTLNVKGGTITGGKTTAKDKNGGNVYVFSNGTLNVSGGKIINGHAYNVGGNVFTNGGTLTVSDGEIYGGSRGDNANEGVVKYDDNYSNVQINGGSATLSGGTISGLALSGSVTPTVSGDLEIDTYYDETTEQTSIGLYRGSNYVTIVAPFTGKIKVSQTGRVTNATTAEFVDCFEYVGTGYETVFNEADSCIYIYAVKSMCVCGNKIDEIEGVHTHNPVEFHAWLSDNSLPTDTGNYYLTKAVTLTDPTVIDSEETINIDLNGKTVTLNADANTDRVFDFTVEGTATVNLTNSTGTGTVQVGTPVSGQTGALVSMTKSGHTFNLYNGKLDASAVTAGKSGVAVAMSNGSFNMYDGTLTGGTASSGGGGTAKLTGGTFTLYDGTVTGGRHSGSNNGGNFYVGDATLNVKGGEITNGYTKNVGGNIFVMGSAYDKAFLNVSGGEIYGGTCDSSSQQYANVQINKGTANLSGGVVTGLATDGNGYLTLSGNATIEAYTGSDGKLYGFHAGKPATINDTEVPFTGIIKASKSGQVTNENETSYVANVVSVLDGYVPGYSAKKIYLTEGKMMCVCGGNAEGVGDHECKEVPFYPWKNATLPTSGNYYLTGTLNLSGNPANISGSLSIDLNGNDIIYTSTTQDGRVFHSNTKNNITINLTNSASTGGRVSVVDEYTNEEQTRGLGALVFMTGGNNTFNLYDGTLDASNLTATYGTAVAMDYKSDDAYHSAFNMYGGQILGGKATTNGGGAVMLYNGDFTLYGGTVSDGQTTATNINGGNFYVNSGCELKVAGGKIINGHAYNVGGNVFVNGGTLTVSGGEIYGGSIYNNSTEEVKTKLYDNEYSNVQINGGSATLSGGTISGLALSGTVTPTVSGGLVINNQFTDDETSAVVTTKGLYVGDNVIAIDDEKGFTGSIALSFIGQVTTPCDTDYHSRFSSLVADYEPLYDETDKCVYNGYGEFAVGYSKVDITPDLGAPLAGYSNSEGRLSTANLDYLYMTCVAITDENGETVLMYTMDLINAGYASSLRSEVQKAVKAYGIRNSNIIITATHTHSAPDLDNQSDFIATYKTTLKNAAAQAAVNALADLTKVEQMSFGTGNTSNLSYVRHYTLTDGTSISDNHLDNMVTDDSDIAGHTTTLDAQMRILKFARADGKTPVLLVNWQSHPHRTGGSDELNVSADIVGAMRSNMESSGYLFAYYQGGAGNVNPTSRISSEQSATPADYLAHGAAMASVANTVLSNMTTVSTGRIKVAAESYVADAIVITEEQKAAAEDVINYYNLLDKVLPFGDKFTYVEKYGQEGIDVDDDGIKDVKIYSYHHALAIKNLYNANQQAADPTHPTRNIAISAITIGDSFAWCTVGGELFDSTAQGIRNSLTDAGRYSFVTGYTNGHSGYIPSSEAYDYNCYEEDVTKVVQGTAEAVATRLITMVNGGE